MLLFIEVYDDIFLLFPNTCLYKTKTKILKRFAPKQLIQMPTHRSYEQSFRSWINCMVPIFFLVGTKTVQRETKLMALLQILMCTEKNILQWRATWICVNQSFVEYIYNSIFSFLTIGNAMDRARASSGYNTGGIDKMTPSMKHNDPTRKHRPNLLDTKHILCWLQFNFKLFWNGKEFHKYFIKTKIISNIIEK